MFCNRDIHHMVPARYMINNCPTLQPRDCDLPFSLNVKVFFLVFTLFTTIRSPPSRLTSSGLLTRAAGDSGYLLITAGEQNIKKALTQRTSGSDLPAIPATCSSDCIVPQLVTATSVTNLSPNLTTPPPQEREGGRERGERDSKHM